MQRDNHVLKFGVYVYIEAWSMDHGPVLDFSIGTLWENSVDKKGFHQTHPNKEKKMEETEMVRSRFKRVCVFCGSSTGKRDSYRDAALELAQELVKTSRTQILYFLSNFLLIF